MKKAIIALSTVIACCTLSSCGMPGMAGAQTPAQTGTANTEGTSGAIGNIISIFTGGIMTNQSALIGKWAYSKPAVQFESSSLLAKAGGAVAAAKVESQLDGYYRKVGITPGNMVFNFANDNTVQYNIGSRSMTGKYQFDANNKTVTITTQSGATVKAYVSISVGQMALTFDASKLLTLVNSAAAASSQLSGISSIASSFSGMKVGFTFAK